MTFSAGKKSPQRHTVFGLWIPIRTNKPVTFNDEPDSSPAESPESDSPTSAPLSTSDAGRDGFKIRWTRSGSRLLSFLGLGASNRNKLSTESRSTENADVDESPRSLSALITEQDSLCTASDSRSEIGSPETVCLSSVPNQSPGNASDRQTEDSTDAEVLGEDAESSGFGGSILHSAISNEQDGPPSFNLVNRLSQKLSVPFAQPTVIRRTHLRLRPSIYFLDSPVSPMSCTLLSNGDGTHDNSDSPSTPGSSGGSPFCYSTPPTPLTSTEPSPSSEKSKISPLNLSDFPDHALTVRSSPPVKSMIPAPSILTVEAASAARIYFELYFNSLLQNVNPRLQRQHELEQHMYAFQLTKEEKLETRRNWMLQENEYLRQCRAMKTSLRYSKCASAASIAGYEVVKFLGKGSFGVVQLVRERPFQGVSDEDPTTKDSNPRRVRNRSLSMLKSAMEGTKHARRRRFMTGETKEVFAMKVIKKSAMIRNCQEGHIRAERDFLVASEESHWVVQLIASFQDECNLYLVMDYMVGGDFLGLLIRKDILSEDWTRFYIAEMLLCIEETHRLSWIHRDIKPDNFLISASGHLKISDFGLAFNGHWSYDQNYYSNQRYSLLQKLGISVKGDAHDQKHADEQKKESDAHAHEANDVPQYEMPSADLLERRNSQDRRRFAKSVVGTSQYMAPEVVKGEMYDGRCDWWSLGIILYECLYGFTPFAREDRQDTKISIVHHAKTLCFPRDKRSDKMISRNAIDLISRILQEREDRLCSEKYLANDILAGRPVSPSYLYSMDSRYTHVSSYYVYPDDATDIKAHPFFKGIPWNELHLVQPPMIPRVRGWEDTRYFADMNSAANPNAVHFDCDHEANDRDIAARPDAMMKNTSEERAGKPASSPIELPGGKAEPGTQQAAEAEKKKSKDRPRDKILRDGKCGRTALEIRKRGAFLGYTYRRPKRPAMALSSERGRRPFIRAELADLYSAGDRHG